MLTAWAVAEIPGLHIDGYRDTSTADLDRVTCRTPDGAVISIASPLTAEAAGIQDREHRVGQLLSAGVRERLGFDVPHTLGAGVLNTRRIVVTEEAQGQPMSAIRDVRPMLPSLSLALASLHSLPTTIVKRDAVPTKTALDSLREAAGIIDRAHQTTRVPSALLDRWDAAIEDQELWQFVPTVIHGNLEFEYVLTAGDDVVGIIHWADACVGDPAVDVKFIVGPLPADVSSGFVTDYLAHRSSTDVRVGHRARFLAELDIAAWLVHGFDTNDEGTIEDAVTMLNNLLAAVADNPATTLGAAPIKPVNLLIDGGNTLAPVADVPFVDDAPTVVAEVVDVEVHIEDEVPTESEEAPPAFDDDQPTRLAEQEQEPVIVNATIVEAFFSEESAQQAEAESLDGSESANDSEPAAVVEPAEAVEAPEPVEPADSQDNRPREDEIF